MDQLKKTRELPTTNHIELGRIIKKISKHIDGENIGRIPKISIVRRDRQYINDDLTVYAHILYRDISSLGAIVEY